MNKKRVVLVVAGVLGLSCCVVIGPWVLIWLGFVLEDAGKERALQNSSPTTLADAVGYKYATPEMVAKFIDRGEDVNQKVSVGNGRTSSLVRLAASTSNVEVARLLIRRGAKVEDAGLWDCARAGREAMARMLIEQGATLGRQPDAEPEIGPELIQAAAFGHQPWLIRLLLAKSADVHVLNANGEGLLGLALETESMTPGPESNSAETTKALLAAGAEVNVANHTGYTPLHWAAHRGKAEEIGLLLAAGAALDGHSGERGTPLAVAVEQCQPEAASLLISRGASRSALTPRGKSLAEGACYYRYPEINRPAKEKILALLAH